MLQRCKVPKLNPLLVPKKQKKKKKSAAKGDAYDKTVRFIIILADNDFVLPRQKTIYERRGWKRMRIGEKKILLLRINLCII